MIGVADPRANLPARKGAWSEVTIPGRCNANKNRSKAAAGIEAPIYCAKTPVAGGTRCRGHGGREHQADPNVTADIQAVIESAEPTEALARLLGGNQGRHLRAVKDSGISFFDHNLLMHDAARGLVQASRHHDRLDEMVERFAEMVADSGAPDAGALIVLSQLQQAVQAAHRDMGTWNQRMLAIMDSSEAAKDKAGRVPILQVHALVVVIVAQVGRLVKDHTLPRDDITRKIEDFISGLGLGAFQE